MDVAPAPVAAPEPVAVEPDMVEPAVMEPAVVEPGGAEPTDRPRYTYGRRRRSRTRRWLTRVALSLVLLPVLVLGGTAARVWWAAQADDHPVSDVILVLGAAEYDGRPSDALQARLEHALALFQAGVAPRIVTVGGRRAGDRFSEAGASQDWLVEHGVDPLKILPVEQGSDTLLSVRAAAAVMHGRGWTSVVVVTDPWHELRARRMVSDAGFTAHASPTRTGPSVGSVGTDVRYVGRETVAYLYYRTFHRASRAGPGAY